MQTALSFYIYICTGSVFHLITRYLVSKAKKLVFPKTSDGIYIPKRASLKEIYVDVSKCSLYR